MLARLDVSEVNEPPSIAMLDQARAAALVERVCAVTHLAPSAHVAVIGHRTLPFLIEFLKRGCCAVRSLRPGAPSPDCEAVSLAWIVDVADGELDDALRAARSRAGRTGRVIVEGAANLPQVRERAVAQGLDVVSFDHIASRLVLATVQRSALAA